MTGLQSSVLIVNMASIAAQAALVAITATDSSVLRETIDHILFAPR